MHLCSISGRGLKGEIVQYNANYSDKHVKLPVPLLHSNLVICSDLTVPLLHTPSPSLCGYIPGIIIMPLHPATCCALYSTAALEVTLSNGADGNVTVDDSDVMEAMAV